MLNIKDMPFSIAKQFRKMIMEQSTNSRINPFASG